MKLEKVSCKPKFNKPVEFWCNVCDERLVKSNDEATGEFFKVSGHILDHKEVGDHCSIVFAVCYCCLKRKGGVR